MTGLPTKPDLIDIVQGRTGMSRKDATALVDTTLQGIVELTTNYGCLTIREFGRFEMRERSARTVTNGYGGVACRVPARRSLCFTGSKTLTEVIQ